MSDITNVLPSPNAAVDGKPNKILNLAIVLTAIAAVVLGVVGIETFGNFVDQYEIERVIKAAIFHDSCGPLSPAAQAKIKAAEDKAIHRNPKKFAELAQGVDIYEIFWDRASICAIVKSYER